METPAGLHLEGVSKSFGATRALTDVSLTFPRSAVTALMGENGAGKSTLLKIMGGDLTPDTGTVNFGGTGLRLANPAAARRLGIRIVAQEPEVIPHVDVAENIFVGRLPARRHLLTRRAVHEQARALIQELGFGGILSPRMLGSDLSPAQRQLVEIARALVEEPSVIAFDEPTSSLTSTETEILFDLIRGLRQRDIAIVYVSHRMNEIFEIADDVCVLRDGCLVASQPVTGTSEDELVRLMVGRQVVALRRHEATAKSGQPVLQLANVCNEEISNVDLTVHAGEIVGVAGLIGAGRSELARTIFGDLPIVSGSIQVDGHPYAPKSPREAIAAGIGFAPEERKRDALFMAQTIRENVSIASLAHLTRARVVARRTESAEVATILARLRVKTTSSENPVRTLSGGNQQKVVLGRWLLQDRRLLILDEPTRGVDVGAKAEIHAIIDDLAARGVAILLISSELPEVLGLSDRVVVMCEGRITGELAETEATEESVLRLAMRDNPSALNDATEN